MKKIVYILISLFFLTACDKEQVPDYEDIDSFLLFGMTNSSGVEVAVVVEALHKNIPDSLVLIPEMVFLWWIDRSYILSDNLNDPVKVYFNKTTVVSYGHGMNEGRDPRDPNLYTGKLIENGLEYSLFNFTVEDYQWALEQNNTKE